MSTQTDALAAFRASLSDIDVGVTVTAPDGFEDALAAAVSPSDPGDGTPPGVVGAPLSGPDGDGPSLPALPGWVETDPTAAELRAATVGVTPARFGVADLGTVAVPSTPGGAEPLSLYPDRHVAVLRAADVVPDVPAAMDRLAAAVADRRSLVFATGASATADMGELVEGVHGPTAVHVVVVDAEAADGDGAGDGEAAGDGADRDDARPVTNGATPAADGGDADREGGDRR